MPSRFYITLTTLLVVYFQITNGVDVANSNIDWSTAVVDKCTTIIVAKGAGRDGPMVRYDKIYVLGLFRLHSRNMTPDYHILRTKMEPNIAFCNALGISR